MYYINQESIHYDAICSIPWIYFIRSFVFRHSKEFQTDQFDMIDGELTCL